MASGKAIEVAIILALLGMLSVLVLGEGGVECEKLPIEMCAFSVSSSGARCVLEKKYSSTSEGSIEYQCQSSGIIAEELKEWIESEDCLQSCGLQRMSVGMSTDDLFENSDFTSKLCSSKCQNRCPNIVNLYQNLAAGEEIYLPHMCEARNTRNTRSRRMMIRTASAPSVGGLKSFSLGGASAPAPE
ncbi:hypothetical protein SUGI_0775520 [Cryptomeria japonica]|uniref:uncharacterized protein LOC131074582 n=1 Tax=Cryptomeria japonica TaxID=3369 RepID=UPI002414AF08|nr:uncharacterized protein LOC131074582 [Cryptomeria japonica]GLJ38096.1 hypothetical protein SUGI_0775520 [Cryptomeria japonica]